MNTKGRIKNFNRSRDHRKSMFKNLAESFAIHGKVETTLPKAKFLKSILEKENKDAPVYLLKTGFRKGDNAEMAILLNAAKFENLNKPAKKEKSK